MVHLDTDTVIAYFNGNRVVADRIRAGLPAIGVSALVGAELLFGAKLSVRAAENRSKVLEFLEVIAPVPFDESCAAAFADIKAELRRIGKPTGEMDALIAATAVAHQATLVTHNRRHYENIVGLCWEDWLD